MDPSQRSRDNLSRQRNKEKLIIRLSLLIKTMIMIGMLILIEPSKRNIEKSE